MPFYSKAPVFNKNEPLLIFDLNFKSKTLMKVNVRILLQIQMLVPMAGVLGAAQRENAAENIQIAPHTTMTDKTVVTISLTTHFLLRLANAKKMFFTATISINKFFANYFSHIFLTQTKVIFLLHYGLSIIVY